MPRGRSSSRNSAAQKTQTVPGSSVHYLKKKCVKKGLQPTRGPLTPRDVHHVSGQGVHPLALLGVLAIVTQVDGSGAALRQLSVIGCHDGAPQNLKGLFVAGHQHTHVVWQPHLQAIVRLAVKGRNSRRYDMGSLFRGAWTACGHQMPDHSCWEEACLLGHVAQHGEQLVTVYCHPQRMACRVQRSCIWLPRLLSEAFGNISLYLHT